ncbi:hypothetical protein EJB05_41796, partial [Eragrostis curvula]
LLTRWREEASRAVGQHLVASRHNCCLELPHRQPRRGRTAAGRGRTAWRPRTGSGAQQRVPERVPNTTWEASLHYKKISSSTEDQCRANCLSDFFCVAALMTSGTECAEMAALTNGRQANDAAPKALIKVRTSKQQSALAATAVLPYKVVTNVLGLLLVVAAMGSILALHHLNKKNTARQEVLGVGAFSWKELHRATNGFEKLLGKGSSGEVYLGVLKSANPPQHVAVKWLVASMRRQAQDAGARVHARAVEYFDDGCASPFIHYDIKLDNILLDGRDVPRITNFGISKLLGSHQVHATVTNVRSTRGYIAPEWIRGEARVDTKADVSSVHGGRSSCCPGMTRADTTEDLERVERYARVAFWCMEPNPALRPTMHQVVQMLEGATEAEVLPDPPACYLE